MERFFNYSRKVKMCFPEFIEKLPTVNFPAADVKAFLIEAPRHQVVFVRSHQDMVVVSEHSREAQ